jgi:H+/Cl- antiporter ClcA
MSDRRNILFSNSLIYAIIWFVFLTVSSGASVPMGIFMPCIVIGCAVGQMYYYLHYLMFPFNEDSSTHIHSATFAILGATSVLAGSTRMTYSLAVIMLETTSSVELFLPIVFTLFVSYGTGSLLINKSIYLSALRSKNIPILAKNIPKINRDLRAKDLMRAHVRCFHFITSVQDLYHQLCTTTCNGFPVLNQNRRIIGIIERDVIITLIEH